MLFHLKININIAEIVHRGHEIAVIDRNMCTGCGNCQTICQFNAVTIVNGKAELTLAVRDVGFAEAFTL